MKKAIPLFLILCISTVLLSACSPPIPTSDQYVEGYDLQNMFGNAPEFRMCASDDSYYYLAPTGTIYIIDKQTLNCVPFCSKPNCKHNNAQCTARTQSWGIWMYQDALYVIDPRSQAEIREDYSNKKHAKDPEKYALETHVLYKISLDGTTKDAIRKVGVGLSGFIHRGYYYANDFDGVRRYSLTDKEENELLFKNQANMQYSIQSIYGNHIYVLEKSRGYENNYLLKIEKVKEENEEQTDTKEADPTVICSSGYPDSTDETRVDETYIGSFGEELVMMTISTHTDYSKLYSASVSITDREGKNEQVLDYIQSDLDTTMFGSVLIDDQYCYQLYVPPITGSKELWQKSALIIYDRESEEKAEEIPMFEQYGSPYALYTGDERYLFLEFEPGTYYENGEYITVADTYRTLYILDKQQIGNGAELRKLLHLTQ